MGEVGFGLAGFAPKVSVIINGRHRTFDKIEKLMLRPDMEKLIGIFGEERARQILLPKLALLVGREGTSSSLIGILEPNGNSFSFLANCGFSRIRVTLNPSSEKVCIEHCWQIPSATEAHQLLHIALLRPPSRALTPINDTWEPEPEEKPIRLAGNNGSQSGADKNNGSKPGP